MYIIFGHKAAEELRKKYFVMQLESFMAQGVEHTAFCVLKPESVVMTDMHDMERLGRLHQAVVDAWNRSDYTTVTQGMSHLKGKFSGELDSFYEELEKRIAILTKDKEVDNQNQ